NPPVSRRPFWRCCRISSTRSTNEDTFAMNGTLDLAATLAADPQIWRDFQALCDCGGRLAGTTSEKRALAYVQAQAEAATGIPCQSIPVPYGGWSARAASLTLADGTSVPCQPLVRSVATPPGGLMAEVVDLGRGTPEEFAAHAADIKGRIVLV